MKFALTLKDLEAVFHDFDVEYVQFGHTESNSPTKFSCLNEISGLLVSANGDPGLDEKYILATGVSASHGRKIVRNDGSVVWAWDNLTIDGPTVSFGGVYKDRYIIGNVDVAAHLSDSSKNLLKKISYRISKNTVSVKGVRISKELYEARVPLSFSIKINREYDFQYE